MESPAHTSREASPASPKEAHSPELQQRSASVGSLKRVSSAREAVLLLEKLDKAPQASQADDERQEKAEESSSSSDLDSLASDSSSAGGSDSEEDWMVSFQRMQQQRRLLLDSKLKEIQEAQQETAPVVTLASASEVQESSPGVSPGEEGRAPSPTAVEASEIPPPTLALTVNSVEAEPQDMNPFSPRSSGSSTPSPMGPLTEGSKREDPVSVNRSGGDHPPVETTSNAQPITKLSLSHDNSVEKDVGPISGAACNGAPEVASDEHKEGELVPVERKPSKLMQFVREQRRMHQCPEKEVDGQPQFPVSSAPSPVVVLVPSSSFKKQDREAEERPLPSRGPDESQSTLFGGESKPISHSESAVDKEDKESPAEELTPRSRFLKEHEERQKRMADRERERQQRRESMAEGLDGGGNAKETPAQKMLQTVEDAMERERAQIAQRALQEMEATERAADERRKRLAVENAAQKWIKSALSTRSAVGGEVRSPVTEKSAPVSVQASGARIAARAPPPSSVETIHGSNRLRPQSPSVSTEFLQFSCSSHL